MAVGRRADEPGNDRHHAPGQQGMQLRFDGGVRFRPTHAGAAEISVGHNQLCGVNRYGLGARRSQGGRHDPGRHPFTKRDGRIGDTRRRFAENADRAAQLGVLFKDGVNFVANRLARVAGWYQLIEHLIVALAQFLRRVQISPAVARGGLAHRTEQRISRARHGRNHHDHAVTAPRFVADDAGHVGDRFWTTD